MKKTMGRSYFVRSLVLCTTLKNNEVIYEERNNFSEPEMSVMTIVFKKGLLFIAYIYIINHSTVNDIIKNPQKTQKDAVIFGSQRSKRCIPFCHFL